MVADRSELYARAYSTVVVPDQYSDGGITYQATHPELPGCMAHGDTPEEALTNLEEARKLYIDVLVERGLEVPTPCPSRLTITWRSLGWVVPSHHVEPATRHDVPSVINRQGRDREIAHSA